MAADSGFILIAETPPNVAPFEYKYLQTSVSPRIIAWYFIKYYKKKIKKLSLYS
jgi:hypothetical protein